jgi:hypothetical protein
MCHGQCLPLPADLAHVAYRHEASAYPQQAGHLITHLWLTVIGALLVSASNGEYCEASQARITHVGICRLARYGCEVLQLCLDGTAHVLSGATHLRATRSQDAEHATGQSAMEALLQANADPIATSLESLPGRTRP